MANHARRRFFESSKKLIMPLTTVILFLAAFPAAELAQCAKQSDDSDAQSTDLASMDIEKLMKLKVTTASLFEDTLSNAPGIVSVVTRDELRRFGGMTLGEILQRVPGLTGTSQYFTDRDMVAARGDQTKTAGGHILFLINGRPTREVQEGGIISDLLESFPVEILERIEIVRGPGSVLYGSNAYSAVINLITRTPEANHTSAEGLGGANGAVASSTQFLYKHGDLNAIAAAQLHDAPDWPLTYVVPPSERNLPFAPHVPNVQDVNLLDKGFGAYVGVNYKGLSFMSAFTEFQSTAFVQGTVGETRLTRDFANLGYEHQVTAKWDVDFNLTYTRTTFAEAPYPSATRDSDEAIIEYTNLISLSSKDRLTVGILANRIEGLELYTGVTPATVSAEGRRPGGAFYAQLDHQLLNNLKLIGGFQSNKSGNIPLNTVPRAGVIWNPSSRSSIKMLYGQAFRAPSLDENLLNRPGIVGNPNLKPEKVGTFDLGFGYQADRFQLGMDYFNSRQTNSIVSIAGKPAHYANLGSVTFNGLEVEGKYYFRKDLFLQGSMLYQANHDATGKSDVTPIPNLGFKAGVSYENRNGLTFGLFEVSDAPISGYSTAANPVQGWHNILNGNFRYDLTRHLPFGDRNTIAIIAHANNLFNRTIWLPGWGFNSVDTIPVQQGLVVYAGFQVSFGNN
jgi:outer membrane receptor for ferrienterochelin and colicins